MKSALFLDRDGVINQKLDDDYVKNTNEFVFLPHVRETLVVLRPHFKRIIVVTNQQGVGKGLMTAEVLNEIHNFMLSYLNENQLLIDKIYYCTDLAQKNSANRKPNIGMALQAKNDFPEIDFNTSLMIGDSTSDMDFGRRAGLTTVFFNAKARSPFADFYCNDWQNFATAQFLHELTILPNR